jgi:hypothetical protein
MSCHCRLRIRPFLDADQAPLFQDYMLFAIAGMVAEITPQVHGPFGPFGAPLELIVSASSQGFFG